MGTKRERPNQLILKPVITKVRKDKKMTQEQLCVKINMDVTQLSKLESGENKDPRISTVKRVAKGLGCLMDDLYVEVNDGSEDEI